MSITTTNDSHYTRNVETQTYWAALEIYGYYRVFLSLAILLITWLDIAYVASDSFYPDLLEFLPVIYFGYSFINLYLVLTRRSSYTILAILQCGLDIFFLTAVIALQPQAVSSFSILINVTIAAGALIISPRIALFFAASATVGLFAQLIFNVIVNDLALAGLLWYALLGTSFFATAMLSNSLARQARSSQALVNQHQVDLYNLERLNALIIERLHSGVVIVDTDWQIRLINQSALAAFNQLEQPKHISELSQELADKLAQWQIHQHLNAPQQRILLSHPELVAYLTPLGSSKGVATLIFFDEKETLVERAQQMKLASLGRFTASIAHELRNPLGAIRHAVQLLEESSQNADDDPMIRIIDEQSQRMNIVIKNILHLSRRKETILEEFELGQWLHDFRQQYLQQSPEKINFELSIQPSEIKLLFDPSQLDQILTNLCDNGCRASYRKNNHYKLKIISQLHSEMATVTLDVIDDGPGIAGDQIDKLFEPFYTTEHDGNGLGLYIANELCQANFATLAYVSQEQGACFRITFRRMVDINA